MLKLVTNKFLYLKLLNYKKLNILIELGLPCFSKLKKIA